MEGYNPPKDQGYKVANSYGPIKQGSPNSYAVSTPINLMLPIYQPNEQQKTSKKSRCPRGAKLGETGSCCGWECTRACDIEGN